MGKGLGKKVKDLEGAWLMLNKVRQDDSQVWERQGLCIGNSSVRQLQLQLDHRDFD